MRRVMFAAAAIWLACLTIGGQAKEGLVGYWRFDHKADQITDLSGQGHTAKLTGGEIVMDQGNTALRMDGKTRIEIPSAPDLNLRRGFSIEAMVKPTDLSNGRTIVFKNNQYMLRIDWPVEGSRMSFFVYAGNKWEPRVGSYAPDNNTWCHLFAIWDGNESYLWVNGQPFQVTRPGELPAPNNDPLIIGSTVGFGAGFVGSIEYVKIYAKALSGADVLRKTYNIPEGKEAAGSRTTTFEFAKGVEGWTGKEGATVSAAKGDLTVHTAYPRSIAMNTGLSASIDKKDYLSLRMAVDKGSRANLVFATTRGAGRIPFQTFADRHMHTYVLEPWQWVGWGGNLVALGLAPSEVEGATAHVDYLRVTSEVEAGPELSIVNLWTQSTLPRADRTETIIAKIRNAAGPASRLTLTLTSPPGVKLKGSATRKVSQLGYLESKEISWQVVASKAMTGTFRASLAVRGADPASLSQQITFHQYLHLPKASYVPRPVPIDTGNYTIWTHYCPLWKQGTHIGWKAIEPWPERKPVIGRYNEGMPEVADWHIKYWVEHGISGVIYCWYRANLNGPVQQNLGHAIDGLMKARYLSMIKFGIMWENGCGKGVGSKADLMNNVLPFWIDHYFSNPSYLRVNGKPVLYIWVPSNVTRELGGSDNVREAFQEMRETCRRRGLGGLYIVGCVGSANQKLLEQMKQEGWDASSAYGNSWIPPRQVKTVGDFISAPYEQFVDQQDQIWKAKNRWNILPDITAAMMGWDPRPWREGNFFWSDNTPAKFRDLCLRAKAVMDAKTGDGPAKKTIIFCCWNEFGEGHYIEPTRGYGFSYLDTIRDVFTNAPKQHIDLAPEDVGLGPYDSWYQAARKALHPGEVSTATAWVGTGLAAWTGMMGLDQVAVKKGVLHAVSVTTDPAFSSPALKIRANRYSRVVIDMRVSSQDTAQLFWSTSINEITEASSVRVPTVADGTFHSYVFDVGKNDYWGGCLTSMRFDPTDRDGVTIEIKSIKLE